MLVRQGLFVLKRTDLIEQMVDMTNTEGGHEDIK
jgi:hypothetical protein